MRMNLARPTALLAVFVAPVLAGCASDNYADRVKLSHIDEEVTPQAPFQVVFSEAYVMDSAGDVTVGQRLSEFATQVAARSQPGDRVGAFPLVSYGLRRDGAWVSELGVRLADDITARLAGTSSFTRTLATPELDVQIARKGMKKASFATLPTSVNDAAGLDLTVVVFGTVKRENNQPVNGRDVLTFDLTAMRVADATMLARTQFQVLSDRKENMATFDLADRESLWLIDG